MTLVMLERLSASSAILKGGVLLVTDADLLDIFLENSEFFVTLPRVMGALKLVCAYVVTFKSHKRPFW